MFKTTGTGICFPHVTPKSGTGIYTATILHRANEVLRAISTNKATTELFPTGNNKCLVG